MNRTFTRTALTAGALLLGGAALAPAASASAAAYPPVTPPTTTTVAPPTQECTPVAGQKASDPVPAGRAATVITTSGELPWYCVAPVATTAAAAPAAPATLAHTGAEIAAVGAAGLGLLVAGGALVRGGRRTVTAA